MENFRLYSKYMLQRIASVAAFFFILQIILRIILLIIEKDNVSISFIELIKMISVGLVYDAAVFSIILIPYVLYLTFLPKKFHLGRFDRIATTLCYSSLLYLLLFDIIAELVFWDEFSVRFNFIAVDYLVYTQEVLANIWESYPITWILSAIGFIVFIIFILTKKILLPSTTLNIATFSKRFATMCIYILIPTAFYFSINDSKSEITNNSYVNEITKNGIYSLFTAFFKNQLDYNKFYLTDYDNTELPKIRDLLEENETGQKFVNDNEDDITRFIPGNGKEKHKNVIIVAMESMSASFMQRFGNPSPYTPNLDKLVNNSLFFENLYATGTRTVRGLEAISLSIPPSPGTSIVKRPNNENLSSIGFVFKDRGYDTKFIYGGYGYFDNMNYFFSHNGFDIVDRKSFSKDEQTFANAWGLCDEDLFKKVISEARKSYEKNTPFMDIVMTTSNHRPYTFPSGIEGIPSEGGGRTAGVKYADYAVGKFLESASKEPWFKDTVFVFIADHTAGSAGKEEIAVDKYHIPMFIYSPSFIKPRIVKNLASQIDLAPILLGILDFSYYSRFYGENILEDPDEEGHAFVASYQKLGFITNDSLVILKPGKKYSEYKNNNPLNDSNIDKKLLLETVAFYKHASDWKKHISKINTVKN